MVKVPRVTGPEVRPTAPPNVRLSRDIPLEALGAGASFRERSAAERELAGSLGAFALNEKRRADRIKVRESRSKIAEFQTNYLYDPEKGVLNRLGENSFTIPDEFEGAFNQKIQEIEEGLGNQQQRDAFSEIAQNSRVSMLEKINKHVSGQTVAYNKNVMQSGLINESNLAINGFDDLTNINESIRNQKIIIKEFAQDNGLPEEWVEQKTFDALSKTHIGVINNLISFDSDEARKLF